MQAGPLNLLLDLGLESRSRALNVELPGCFIRRMSGESLIVHRNASEPINPTSGVEET